MSQDVISKTELWKSRIQAYHESGLSQKDWCRQNGISPSTFSYQLRKLRADGACSESDPEPVFARLPSEKEACQEYMAGKCPITIYLSANIKIEVHTQCSPELMSTLLLALRAYA